MPKKQSRQISKSQTDVAQTAAKTFTTSGQVFTNDFNPDYTHVFKDLKRIGILAASFTVILVVLSFFIK
ncbi:MAG: hypothetical protein LWX83_11815 [Anaerolineae bacterium]|nr:hypothetical protein [Anaerolineae bacterium]